MSKKYHVIKNIETAWMFGFIILTSYYIFILKMFPVFVNYLHGIEDGEAAAPCRVPQLNPFDKSILNFIKKPDNIICSQNGPLIVSDLYYLYVNRSLLPAYQVNSLRKFHCCYQAFERENPEETEIDNEISYLGKCKPFSYKVKIEDEYVEVFCYHHKIEIYYDLFSFVPIKTNKNRNKFSNTSQKLNVLIYGIDSMSHMNFQRQMPKTKKYVDEHLNSILMSGFNKVDDNTFPNLMPILTGYSIEELTKTCWETQDTKFDKCYFIWNDYSDAGYLTAFAEDAAHMGIFSFGRRGFQTQPTNYYWRTFNYYAENQIRQNFCLGPRPLHQVLIDYTKKFVSILKNEPYFGFFWSNTLSHDCLNCPSLSDDDYLNFFRGLKRDHVLNNTVVIFLSDHGIRTSDILDTHQGHMEERLPFVYFIFPIWFNKMYPIAINNMRNNSNRLTANYDIHETLKDLLDVENLKTKYLMNNEKDSVGKRGISLFSVVPENRSCDMAGIPSHWCVCKRKYEVYTYSTAVIKVSNYIVSYINKLLINYNECAQLKLKSIKSALLSQSLSRYDMYLMEYTIKLKTMPGGAIFEGTVLCTDYCYEEKFFKISGSISRLNIYGNQSSCIFHHLLRMYCYCI